MKRLLLYDSSCSTCSQLAEKVQKVTGSWLNICSLRDKQARNLLNRVKPSWKWEPTLLEIQDENVRIFTGLSMGFYVAWKLGPFKALHLARIVGEATKKSKSENLGSGRRHFIKQFEYYVAGLGMLLTWSRAPQSSPARSELISSTTRGELYNGFLIVPDRAPIPAEVKPARPISFEGPGDFPVEVVEFDSVEKFLEAVPSPVYLPANLPARFQFQDSRLIKLMQGDVPISATINYSISNYQMKDDEEQPPLISIEIMFDFPQPFPIWPVHDPFSSKDVVLIQPEKVTVPPLGPGILLPSRKGFVFYWIANGVCYSLVSEHSRLRAEGDALARSLVMVKH